MKDGPETCDDSNTVSFDGCSSNCQYEPPYICIGAGVNTCYICGNTTISPGEGCDDGDLDPGDGCSEVC